MFELLVSNRLHPTGLEFRSWAGYPGYPHAEGCVLQVPGRYWHQHTDQINESIAVYRWVLLVRTSDEEDLFDISEIVHPNVKFWVQTPRKDRDYGDARLFGVGYPPHFNDLPKAPPVKDVDVVLSGQDTHERRHEAFAALDRARRDTWQVVPTEGFTKGVPPGCYARDMVSAKVAPAPSGAVSPDSFRLWEALEAHCVPIADTVSPVDGVTGYWKWLLPDAPIPVIRNYDNLPDIVEGLLDGWPANANRVTAWWMRYKREMTLRLKADLEQLGAL